MAQECHVILVPEMGIDIVAKSIISKEKIIEIFWNRLAKLSRFAIDILQSHPDYQHSSARYDYQSWKVFNVDLQKAVITLHHIADLIKEMPEMSVINYDEAYLIDYTIGNDHIAVLAKKDGKLAMSKKSNFNCQRLHPDRDEAYVDQTGRRLQVK